MPCDCTEIPVNKLIKALRGYLNFLAMEIKNHHEEAIKVHMKPRRVWFRMKALTREEAEAHIEVLKHVYGSRWNHDQVRYDHYSRLMDKAVRIEGIYGPTHKIAIDDNQLVRLFNPDGKARYVTKR